MMTVKAFKGWKSRSVSGLIAFNIVASGVAGIWMLYDLNEISKSIPLK